MPVLIPHDLPAKKILEQENIFVMTEKRATMQDIRPLKAAIVNLMPTKMETETQLLRVLSNTALQVNIDLIRIGSHISKNTSIEHLEQFYRTFDEIRGENYDAMIVTGAPIEKLEYKQVTYWKELCEIMDYALEHVFSTMFLCWAAQAAMYHYYGVEKRLMEEKLFGVFETSVIGNSPLTRGFDDCFYAPQSRHTYCCEKDIEKTQGLHILAKSAEAGVHIAATDDMRLIFVAGHSEYDKLTLDSEYRRDLAKGDKISVPKNYYAGDDPEKGVLLRWRSHGNLMFGNWLNYCVYQETPYDLGVLQPVKLPGL